MSNNEWWVGQTPEGEAKKEKVEVSAELAGLLKQRLEIGYTITGLSNRFRDITLSKNDPKLSEEDVKFIREHIVKIADDNVLLRQKLEELIEATKDCKC